MAVDTWRKLASLDMAGSVQTVARALRPAPAGL